MTSKDSSIENSLFSVQSRSSSLGTLSHSDKNSQIIGNGVNNGVCVDLEQDGNSTSTHESSAIDNPGCLVNSSGVTKTHKTKKSLQKLLNDAYKYSSYSEFSLPTSFLRSKKKSPEPLEDGGDHHKASNEKSSSSVTMSNGKGSPRLKAASRDLKIIGKSISNGNSKGGIKSSKAPKRKEKTVKPKPEVKRMKKESKSGHEVPVKLKPVDKVHPKSQKTASFNSTREMVPVIYNLFDLETLETTTKYQGKPIPSTILDHQHHVNAKKIKLKSIIFPEYEEEYVIDFLADNSKYNPMVEVGRIIENTSQIYLPEKYIAKVHETIVLPLNNAFDIADQDTFIECVTAYNKTVNEISRDEILAHLRTVRQIPLAFFHDLLHIVYTRIIHPQVRKLKDYEAFSNYVYGELLPNFLSKVYAQCGLKPGDIFIDLGSGVGNCVMQAALEYGCKVSFGCEIMPNASLLTEAQCKELRHRCQLFGLNLSPIEFSLRKSFVDNDRVNELLTRCDVLLVNNFIFDAKMNKQVESIIQTLKPGCKIITLKNLRPHGYTINFDNVGNILNRLKVERFDLEEGSVSWTHRGGEYYISTVEEDIDDSIFTTYSKGRVRTNKRVKYTR